MAEPTIEPMGFGALMRQLREAKGLTLRAVARAMEDSGHDVTQATLSAWELGRNPPKSPPQVYALELILDARGRLTAALGWESPLAAQVAALESDVAALREALSTLVDRLGPA